MQESRYTSENGGPNWRVGQVRRNGSVPVRQSRQNLSQSDPPCSSPRFFLLEFDPSLVEAVEHLDARPRMLHAL